MSYIASKVFVLTSGLGDLSSLTPSCLSITLGGENNKINDWHNW